MIPSGSIVERNHYALFCTVVQVDGLIRGDLIAFGQTVIVNGTVEGSVLAAGVEIIVNGQVGGSIRAASGELTLTQSASLSGRTSDISAVAIHLSSAIPIPGDVWFAGRSAEFKGGVNGETYLALLPPELPSTPSKRLADFFFGTVQTVFSLMTVGLIGLTRGRSRLERAADRIVRRPLRVFVIGQACFWAVPLIMIAAILILVGAAGVLSALSLGGLSVIAGIVAVCLVSFGIGAGVIGFGVLAPLIAAYTVGRWYRTRYLTGVPGGTAHFIGLLTGTLIIAVLSHLPGIGIIAFQMIAAWGMTGLRDVLGAPTT